MVILLCFIFSAIALALSLAAKYFQVEGDSLVRQVDALLPQTQCGQCKYPGCYPYAEAVVSGDADINQCPPGGSQTISALAYLLGREDKLLGRGFGEQKIPAVAFILEEDCIGCIKCIPPCPVDAILGATKQMHTVITTECTGCELCIAPCPMDCIIMRPVETIARW